MGNRYWIFGWDDEPLGGMNDYIDSFAIEEEAINYVKEDKVYKNHEVWDMHKFKCIYA